MENEKIGNFKIISEHTKIPIRSAPEDMSVEDFINWAVKKLDLPSRDRDGNNLKYFLKLRRTGKTLTDGTLADHDIREQDEVELFREVQATDRQFPSRRVMPTVEIMPATEIDRDLPTEKEALRVVDKLGNRVVDAFNDTSERRYKQLDAEVGVTRYLLIVFSIALLGSLFFTFYLIAIDKLNPVGNFLYPIITLILGFFSGYFAGTGRASGRK